MGTTIFEASYANFLIKQQAHYRKKNCWARENAAGISQNIVEMLSAICLILQPCPRKMLELVMVQFMDLLTKILQ